MRFLMWARRVMKTENAKNAMPPTRSLRLVLSCGLGGWASCVDGSEGPDGDVWRVSSCFGDDILSVLDAFASGFEPEPHPRKESIFSYGFIDRLRFAEMDCRLVVVSTVCGGCQPIEGIGEISIESPKKYGF